MTIAQQGDADRAVKPQGAIKFVRTYVRRKDMTLLQFKDYWLKTHINFHKRLVTESPVVRSVVSFALPPEKGGNEPHFDGLVELYVESADGLPGLVSAAVLAQMREDEKNFVQQDSPANAALVAEESVL